VEETYSDGAGESLLLHDVDDVCDDSRSLQLLLTGQRLHPRLNQIEPVLRIRIREDPKLLSSRIRIRIRNKLISRVRIRIRNYHWGSGLLKEKCSDKNTFFNIKSSIFTDKDPDPDQKKPAGRIRIRNDPPGRIRIRIRN